MRSKQVRGDALWPLEDALRASAAQPSGARDELHLAAILQNLQSMTFRLFAPRPEPAPGRPASMGGDMKITPVQPVELKVMSGPHKQVRTKRLFRQHRPMLTWSDATASSKDSPPRPIECCEEQRVGAVTASKMH
jgi:hypothetical protein